MFIHGILTFVLILSVFQLPFFHDSYTFPSWLQSLLQIIGIEKFRSDFSAGRAMCLGDGVHADKSQIVECPYYSSFYAMGFYAILLSLVIAYVCIS